MIAWWAAWALAQEPTPAAEQVPEPADVEIEVWGESARLGARSALVRRMRELGWRERDRDGHVLFKPPEPWMGRAKFHDEGFWTFGRPLVAFDGGTTVVADADPSERYDALDRGRQSSTVGVSFSAPAPKVRGAAQRRMLEEVADEVAAYRRVLEVTAEHEVMNLLAPRLEAFWSTGAPLDGERGPAVAPEARAAALFDFWATRTETPTGIGACRAVEAFVENAILDAGGTLDPALVAAAEARRADGRRLLPP